MKRKELLFECFTALTVEREKLNRFVFQEMMSKKLSNQTDFEIRVHNNKVARKRLADIDVAIKRIEDDEFGICIECEEEIPVERLIVFPYAKRCISCQTRHEK
jgi:RNA polymerase-binding protein DksA